MYPFLILQKYVLRDLLKELLLRNTKVATKKYTKVFATSLLS
jgi:hypothetical protein